MKQNLKRILPVLLAITVLCSIAWYLFIYDTDFTRDMLVEHARRFEREGKHSLAALLYDRAYVLSGQSDAVAIELAEQFVSIGNYTKAERTLSQAIADGGSVELYTALCGIYVQQDKLKDAVTMLDSIKDPEIKAQLDALRPLAPVVDTAPGFYSQYITVNVQAPEGMLHFTTDLSYPAVGGAQTEGAVTLEGGENTIRALAVNEMGLVSPLVVFGYTVKGVIEEISFADSALEALARQQLQLGGDTAIFTRDLWAVTDMIFPGDASVSADLVHFPYLQTLQVEGSSVDGWSSLSALTELRELSMKDCMLTGSDLRAIAALPKLEKLTLSGCGISSIENLSGMKNLTYLDLSGNTIRNISSLSFMTGLTYLNLRQNALDNISDISGLANLQQLDVSHNSLTSVAPLAACTALTELNLEYNSLSSLVGLGGMRYLTKLDASYNKLLDISVISTCAALTDLNVSNNELADISSLSSLQALLYLNFSRNSVSVLPSFGLSAPLVTIDGSYNQIKSVSTLVGLSQLNKVQMDYNKISAVNDLAQCHSLIEVSVYGNPVSNVSDLTDAGVIVTYTPKT